PIHWILDWDGTLTKRDTLDALVNIAAKCKTGSPVHKEWKRVAEAYMTDYETTLGIHSKDGRLPSSISEEKALLKTLEEVEQRSIDRVSESGIFEGLTTEDIENGATNAIESGEVELRIGLTDFWELVQSRIQYQDAVSILSVNWSQRFILACLETAHESLANMLSNSINSNELDGISQGATTTGRICTDRKTRIISSRDKLAHLELLRESTLRQGKPMQVVYVGDSWTDFECLLSADLGICIRDDPMTNTQKKLADSLARVGVSCARLRGLKDAIGIPWTQDFHELRNWMQ
ncbi:hypothetical protein K458DRAFT_242491, partial [Lentithecium fluviatile CBS 122367]